MEIDSRQLVDNHRTFELFLFVDEFHNTVIVKSECCRVDILAVGIISYDQHLRFVGIIDVERKIIARHYPIKGW